MSESFPSEISELYKRPQIAWGASEWKTLCGFLNSQLTEARNGWGESLRHADYFAKESQTLLSNLKIATALLELAEMAGRSDLRRRKRSGRGRPTKYDLSELLRFWNEKIAHERSLAKTKLTQREALKNSFRRMFKAHQLRENRVDSAEFRSKLHTLENLLSKARASLK